jgi:hypothetical protein
MIITFDEDGLSVMQETIQQRGSQGGITDEDSRPVLESDVGDDDDWAALVAFGDDLKERLNNLTRAAGERHDEGNMAVIDRWPRQERGNDFFVTMLALMFPRFTHTEGDKKEK